MKGLIYHNNHGDMSHTPVQYDSHAVGYIKVFNKYGLQLEKMASTTSDHGRIHLTYICLIYMMSLLQVTL